VATTRLWFLRHGEPEARWVGSFIGRTEADLSPLGRHQAQAIAAFLADAHVDAVLASPRRRARDSVAPLAAAKGIPVRIVPGFAEMDFGRWEGLHWPDIERQDPDYAARWQADPSSLPCPGGEGCPDFQERIETTLAATLEEFRGRSIVLGAHAGTCRAILGSVLGLTYVHSFAFAQDYGNLNAVAWPEEAFGAGQIALVNFVPGPKSATSGE